jgi:hypothetical protein
VIGWVNVLRRGGEITIEPGFVSGQPPSGPNFDQKFAEESARLRRFLAPQSADE